MQEFAVGVVARNGEYRLIDSGALPEAVAASAAIPFVFEPVNVPGVALIAFRHEVDVLIIVHEWAAAK